MNRDLTMSTQISKKNTDVFYLSASNKIHQGMFDNGLHEENRISFSFKSY